MNPADGFEVRVLWDDRTPHGLPLFGRLQATVRDRLYPRADAVLGGEMARPAVARRRLPATDAAALVRDDRRRLAHRRLIEDEHFWHPPAALVTPRAVALVGENGDVVSLAASAEGLGLARAILAGGAPPGVDRLIARGGAALAAGGWRQRLLASPQRLAMIGHACVSMSDGRHRLWLDPFLRPKAARFGTIQPLGPGDTEEPCHAILITHGHPDHFDPGSLLRFPADTPVIVPRQHGHDLLSLDLADLASKLGMTDVRPLGWGESVAIGGFTVTAVPFHGEQPLGDGARPGRDMWMAGNGYHVADATGFTILALADCGSDARATAATWARAIRDALGKVDVLLANHRTWRLYPPQYLTTSVPHYLCLVPDAELDRPQRIMLDTSELHQVAAILGAARVIPYAMGGAPWFEELGLGGGAGNHLGGAFDAAPADIFAEDDPDVLVKADGHAAMLPAGASLDDPPGEAAVATGPATHSATPPPSGAVACAFGGLDASSVAALVEHAAARGGVVIATPGFVELIDEAGAAGLPALGPMSWSAVSDHPLTPGVFGGSRPWRDLFLAAHRSGLRALVQEAPERPIRTLLAAMPFTHAPGAAIERIARDLLGLEVEADRRSDGGVLDPCYDLIDLPPDAADLTISSGASPVGMALLTVKLLHNIYLTALAAGRPVATDETAWFALALPGRDPD